MCLPAVTAATAPLYTLAIAAAGTAATVGLSIASANQQASAAQANLEIQSHTHRQQVEMQRQQNLLQHQQQLQSLRLQQQQGIDNRNLQVAQANAQMVNQYNQQREAVRNERAAIWSRHEANKLTYQRSVEQARTRIGLNNEAANRAYLAEQTKVDEARKKAAFQQQALLAKAIGDKGSILAAGRSGQSIGLLINDVERQKGFSQAQINATLDSKRDASLLSMESTYIQNQSTNNQALSNIAFNPQDPYIPRDPRTPQFLRDPVGLAIDSPFAVA